MFTIIILQALLLTTALAAPTPTSTLNNAFPALLHPRQVINTPSPMLSPLHPSCQQFHLASPGETCPSIAASKAIKLADFYKSNPVLGPNGEHCADKLLAGYFYCVKATPVVSGGAMSRPGVDHGVKPQEKKTEPVVDWGKWNLVQNLLAGGGKEESKPAPAPAPAPKKEINLWEKYKPKHTCKAADWLGWCP